ncbi:MAG: hypothetical protein AAF493_01465 [Pseudomonadota bacterium]
MTLTIEEVSEASADKRIAATYADIRTVQNLPIVNLIWRHLATRPAALDWAWERARPIYANGIAARESAAFRAALPIPQLPPLKVAIGEGLGLEASDRATITAIIETYNRGNTLNLTALCALLVTNRDEGKDRPIEPRSIATPTEAPLSAIPSIPALSDLPPSVQRVIAEINAFGIPDGESGFVASLYRHLGYWPSYLSFIYACLAPYAASGELDKVVTGTRQAIAPYAARAATQCKQVSPNSDTGFALDAIETFIRTAICRMVPIGLMLGRALTSGDRTS